MIDDIYAAKMHDLETWSSWNDSDGRVANASERDLFLFRKLRGFVSALVEYVGYQQALEGRVPGDPDAKSTFPFPDALADRKRMGVGPSLILPVGVSFRAEKRIVLAR